ncbi:MAG: HNH endonuclease [Evtepia sp.]
MSHISFYDSRAWRRVRREVLREDNNECWYCKEKHKHTRAEIVHHIYHLEEYPEYGLLKFVKDPKTKEVQRNLISVCRACHETVCHPERAHAFIERQEPITRERW